MVVSAPVVLTIHYNEEHVMIWTSVSLVLKLIKITMELIVLSIQLGLPTGKILQQDYLLMKLLHTVKHQS